VGRTDRLFEAEKALYVARRDLFGVLRAELGMPAGDTREDEGAPHHTSDERVRAVSSREE
jgi:hypothetical protein